MAPPALLSRFEVHAHSLDRRQTRIVEEASFEAAAAAYLEEVGELGDGDEVRVIVRDLDGGREHCFTIDLATGETAPCP